MLADYTHYFPEVWNHCSVLSTPQPALSNEQTMPSRYTETQILYTKITAGKKYAFK